MTTRVEGQGWLRYVLVNVLVVEVVLIAEDMGVLLVCVTFGFLRNPDVAENRGRRVGSASGR